MAPSDPALQFGQPVGQPADRPCAYGIAADDDGLIALVRVKNHSGEWWDLPGGALDPGEGDLEALVREFGEETGLTIRVGRLLTRAGQYMVKSDGQSVNNLSGLYAAKLLGFDEGLKVEDDHHLEWHAPATALTLLRHDSHAWAVTLWMRTQI